jgi:hypothetical protein
MWIQYQHLYNEFDIFCTLKIAVIRKKLQQVPNGSEVTQMMESGMTINNDIQYRESFIQVIFVFSNKQTTVEFKFL